MESSPSSKSVRKNILFIIEVLAITIGLISFVISNIQSNKDRKLEAYRNLGDSYVEIMKLCMAYRCLDCYDSTDTLSCPDSLSLEQIHQQKIIYTIIWNHFEQAFKTLRKNKDLWKGWLIYIDNYLVREKFREVWYSFDLTWSQEFQEFILNRIKDIIVKGKITQLSEADKDYLERKGLSELIR